MSERPTRDPALERLLGALEAPPASGRFHERLWERIDAAETASPVARPRRRWVRRPRLAGAVLIAAAATACVAVWLVGWPASRDHGLVGPPPAVAQVIRQVRLRLDSCRSLSAVFTYERAGLPPFRGRVLATSDGRMRTMAIAAPDGSWRLPPADATLTDTPGLHIEVVSQPDGTRTEAWDSADGLTVARDVGLAPGPPDAAGSGLFPAEYAGQMSALAMAGAEVSSAMFEGRRVLVVSAPAGPASSRTSGESGVRYDEVSMVVDRRTWLPIRVVRSYKGAVMESWSLRDVRLDLPVLASDFAVQLPSSAELVTGRDEGFHRLPLAKASRIVRGRLFVPESLPGGFDLSLVTVRTEQATLDKPWSSGESHVASLVYRRGFRSVVVTTRSFTREAPAAAADPFVPGPPRASGADRLLLRDGGLAGAMARVSARPLDLPHLWVVHGGLLVTVAGDVTRRELRQIAESLQTYPVWRTREVFDAYSRATRSFDLHTLGDLYASGVRIDGKSYAPGDTQDALTRHGERADYLASGKTVATFVGARTAVWEAWPGDELSVGGWQASEAVAEVVSFRDDAVASEEYFWIGGPNRRAGEAVPHPARLRTPLGRGDTAAAARKTALAYAAGLERKDAAALARISTQDVAFLDVGFGDHGRLAALTKRYRRMFRFPSDLEFRSALVASGPGWAVVRWTAASDSLGYDRAGGLTVLEIRGAKVARETLYSSKDLMPFR